MYSLKLTIPLAAIGGLVAAWLGRVWVLVALVLAAVMLDYITGLLAGRATEGLSSKRAKQGVYKKIGFLSLMTLAFFLDVAFDEFIALGFQYEMPFNMPIGLIVSVWIVVTEAISICENIQRLGVEIPPWMTRLLCKAKKDSSGE